MPTFDLNSMKPARKFATTNERPAYTLIGGKTALNVEVNLRVPTPIFQEAMGTAVEPTIERILAAITADYAAYRATVKRLEGEAEVAFKALDRAIRTQLSGVTTSSPQLEVETTTSGSVGRATVLVNGQPVQD